MSSPSTSSARTVRPIERFEFDDGTVWTVNDLRLQYLQKATTQATTQSKASTPTTLSIGGAGNDNLNGSNGSDTYHVGIGTGKDIIAETTYVYSEDRDTDTLQFGAGSTAAQVQFTRVGNNLVLKWNGVADSVTVMVSFIASSAFGGAAGRTLSRSNSRMARH